MGAHAGAELFGGGGWLRQAHEFGEDAALGAEDGEDGLDGDAGGLGDGLDGGARTALLGRQHPRGGEDAGAGLGGLTRVGER
jgi:hypothetical protein